MRVICVLDCNTRPPIYPYRLSVGALDASGVFMGSLRAELRAGPDKRLGKLVEENKPT